jgi:PAS domain S-box-containing protein
MKVDSELVLENEQLLKGIEQRQGNLNKLSKYLSELESQLSLIFAASPDIILFLDTENKILKISDAATRILGYSKEEMVGKQVWDFICEEDLEKTKEKQLQVKKETIAYFDGENSFVSRWKTKYGSFVRLLWRFSICVKNQLIGVATDITHFGTNDIYNFKLLQNAVESSMDGIAIIDAQKEGCPIVYANNAYEEITGYEQSEIVGRLCRFLETDESKESRAVKTLCHHLKTGQTSDVLLQCMKKNGDIFYNHLIVSPVLESGKIVNYISIVRDVTESIGVDFDWSPNTDRGFAPASSNNI